VGAVRRRAGAETFRLLPLFLYSLLALLGAGALLKPGFDLGPEALLGAASGHKADMAGVDDEELFSSLDTRSMMASACGRRQM
jgi:hypothetical protein